MSNLARKRTEHYQPTVPAGIDMGNPICRMLHHACTLVGGRAILSVPNALPRTADGVHTFTGGTSRHGTAATFAGSTSTAVIGYSGPAISEGALSILWIGRRTGSGGNNLGRIYDMVSSTGAISLAHLNSTTVTSTLNAAATTFPLGQSATQSVNTLLVNISASSMNVWVDSAKVATSGTVGTGWAFTGVARWGNNSISAGNRAHQGDFVLGALWIRKLEVNEVLSVLKNPWQIYQR